MSELSELNRTLTSCSFVALWLVWVELADRDDARVPQAVVDAVGLEYGPYEGVAFESGSSKPPQLELDDASFSWTEYFIKSPQLYQRM